MQSISGWRWPYRSQYTLSLPSNCTRSSVWTVWPFVATAVQAQEEIIANPADMVVRGRIDAETRAAASRALQKMGLSISDYSRMALVRVAHNMVVPFAVYGLGSASRNAAIVWNGKGRRDEH